MLSNFPKGMSADAIAEAVFQQQQALLRYEVPAGVLGFAIALPFDAAGLEPWIEYTFRGGLVVVAVASYFFAPWLIRTQRTRIIRNTKAVIANGTRPRRQTTSFYVVVSISAFFLPIILVPLLQR